MEQVPSQDVSKAVPSPTQIPEAERGSPWFLRAVPDILQRFFRLLLFLSSTPPAKDSNIKHRGTQEVFGVTKGKPLYETLKSGQIRVYCMECHHGEPIKG
jgi:hypothetical protein